MVLGWLLVKVIILLLTFCFVRQVSSGTINNAETDTLSKDEKNLELDLIILDRVMVIGNPENINKIPGSAFYIDKKSLDKQSYNNINRILQQVPGINLQEEGGYGLRPNIGMRGTSVERSSKITVMEDGVLTAPAPYSAPAAYYFPTPGRMQGIEVRKGSSQIKFGPYTTGGALNLISTVIPFGFKGRTYLFLGNNGSKNIHVNVGNSHPNFGYVIETYLAKVDGFKKLDNGNNTGFDKKDYLSKLRFNTDRSRTTYQEITFKLTQTNEVSNETYLGLTDKDFKANPYHRYAASQVDQMDTGHEQFQARYFLQLKDSFDLTTILYRNNFRRNWYKLNKIRATENGNRISISSILSNPEENTEEYAIAIGSSSPNDNALEVKANNREYYSQGIQSIAGLQANSGKVKHNLEIGLRLHKDQIDRFQWEDKYKMNAGTMLLTQSGVKGTESNRIETALAWATFVQYVLSTGSISITSGMRYENIRIEREDFGKNDPSRIRSNLKTRKNNTDVWIPGIGLEYKFSSSTNAFVGIHKGFAPPGSKEGTKPENSINTELGYRYHKNDLHSQAIIYFNNYSNLLGSDLSAAGGTGSGDQFNGGKATALGLEFNIKYDLNRAHKRSFSAPFHLAYTYTLTQFKSDFKSEFKPWGTISNGDELPYIPKHQVFLNLGVEKDRWRADMAAKYTGKMRTKADSGPIQNLSSTDAYFVFDATGEITVSPKSKVFIGFRNLTNKVYIVARRPAGVRPGMPRSVVGGIKTNF